MDTPTVLSDSGSRQRHGRKSSSKKSFIVHSDYFDDSEAHSCKESVGRRSPSNRGPGVRPRMAQLETLEAKMANIEVSLSTTPRRRKSGSLGGRLSAHGPYASQHSGQGAPVAQVAPQVAPQLPPQVPPPPPPVTSLPPLSPPATADPLRAQLKDKEDMIQSLKDQLCTTMSINRISHKYIRGGGGGGGGPGPLGEAERRAAEERLQRLRQDMDAKRLTIKNLKLALERLDITDNIDVRIQQAELEYQLGREELEHLTLLEQSRALQLLLEQDDSAKTRQDQQTIFSCLEGPEEVSLHAVQVHYDPKSPQFGAGPRQRRPGLWVDWALEHTALCKGDRLLEVNGKLVLSKTKEDMTRLLSISPSPAQLVVMRLRLLDAPSPLGHNTQAQTALVQVGTLRAELGALREQAEEARRTKDGLRSDNLRLTHRISYLEEQVADLLDRNKGSDPEVQLVTPQNVLTSTVNMQKNVTNINITSEPNPKTTQPKSEVQVFQKGPDVTALVANIPGLEIGGKGTAEASANLPIIRPKSNNSNVSSTQIAIGNSPKSNGSKSSLEQNDTPKIHSPSPYNHVHFNHKSNKNGNYRHSLQTSRSSNSLNHGEETGDSNLEMKPYSIRQSLSHHSIHKQKDYKTYDYNSETSAAIEIIKKNQKQYLEANYKNLKEKYNSRAFSDDNSDVAKSYKRDHRKSSILDYLDKGLNGNRRTSKLYNDSRSVESLNNHDSEDNGRHKHDRPPRTIPKSIMLDRRIPHLGDFQSNECIDFHPDRDYVDHRIDGKIIQNAHKSSRRMSKLHVRNIKSADCDSEPSQNVDEDKYRKSRTKILDYTSEPNSIQGHYKKHYQNLERPRPTPPKKPLRLSLHRAQSMQSVEPNRQSDTFYLHDPLQRQASASDVAKDESKFSISNINTSEVFFSNQSEYKIKPDNSYNDKGQVKTKGCLKNGDSNDHPKVSFSDCKLSNNHNNYLQDNKKVKKRSHNGKISQSSIDVLFLHNGNEDVNGYVSSRSESLTSIPKSAIKTTNSKESLYNGFSDRFSAAKDRSKAELQMKSSRVSDDYTKNGINGYSNFDKCESASESSRTPSRSDSYQSGFRWPSSSVFKNIRIDSSRSNGHMSDGSKK